MPDVSSAPAIPPPTALYPQPPSQTGLASNPAQVLDLLTRIQQNYQLQQELKARAAIGQAYQGAQTPDGVDPQKLRAGILNNPDALWLAPQATQAAQDLARAQFETRWLQDQATRSVISTLPYDATDEQLRHYGAGLARAGVPPDIVEVHRDYLMSLRGKERSRAIAAMRATALGPAGTAQQIEGPPGTGGEMQRRSLGETLQDEAARSGSGAVAGPGGYPVGLPPGGAESALEMRADLSHAGQFGQEIFPWQQALDKIRDLKGKYGAGFFGPGSKGRQEFESYFYGLVPSLARNLGVSEDKLRNYAEAEKYLTQALQSRAGSLGADTNEKLATTARGSPNVGVTDLAVDELVPASIAAMRAQQAQILQASKAGGPNYTAAKSRWSANNDIRAFMLDLLPADQRAKLLGSLKKGSPEYQRFNNSLKAAYETGVMDRPSATTTVAPRAPGARKDQSRATTGEAFRSLPPDASAPPPKPPVPGVQLGRRADGTPAWFIQDPARPGKHLEVKLPGLQ